MMKPQNRSGFTILEMLVTITVTMVVLGGTLAMFTKINQSVIDTGRNNDFTFQNRSLVDMLRQDFVRAGRGMNDLSVFNMNHEFASVFATTSAEGRLYPVAELAYDDSTKTSEIVLHYFDYDMTGTASDNQTFQAMLDAGDSGLFGDSMSYMNLMSNDETAIDNLAVGDIVMVYRFDALRQSKAFNLPDKNPWINQLIDGFRTNDAVILEVTEIDDKEDLGGSDDTIQFRRKIRFGDGNVFVNGVNTANIETQFESGINNPSTVISDISTWLFESSTSRVPGLWQKGVFFARKLGDAGSFHRVHYRVQNQSGVNYLLRIENGVQEIVAENVEEFHVFLGIDTPNGIEPGSVNNSNLDGYVSTAEPTQWTRAYNDPDNSWSISEQQFNQIIGRHSVSAIVRLTQKVAYPDPRTGVSAYKDRAFEHQFKLSLSRPSQYQVSNPYE